MQWTIISFHGDDHTLKPNFHSARRISTRQDMFDVSSTSRRAFGTVLFDKLNTAKMHGLDTSNVSC